MIKILFVNSINEFIDHDYNFDVWLKLFLSNTRKGDFWSTKSRSSSFRVHILTVFIKKFRRQYLVFPSSFFFFFSTCVLKAHPNSLLLSGYH